MEYDYNVDDQISKISLIADSQKLFRKRIGGSIHEDLYKYGEEESDEKSCS